MTSRTRRLAVAAVAALAIPAAATGSHAVAAGEPVREDLADARNPVGGKGRTLALTRVTIPPGAQLAAHTHPGTEIARIEKGTLTYTVIRNGSVPVYRGDGDSARKVRTLRPGQTAHLRPGMWIVEKPGMVHRAVNRGNTRVVILLSSLFPNGAPPASPAS